MKVITFLRTPFPRPKKTRKNLFWILLLGISASAFILIYKPFGIENETGKWYVDLIIISLGGLFIFSILFMEWLIPSFFPKIFKKWTLGKALLWYSLVIIFIGLNNFLYKSFLSNFKEFTAYDFLLVLGRTVGIGFTVSFFALGIWHYLNRKKISFISANENYHVTSKDGKTISLVLNDILFIRSDDNYVDIHYLHENKRKRITLRSSLKNIESQVVNSLSPIYRCHRQYLINTKYFKIEKFTSRNMTISLSDSNDVIPVSKQYSEQIKLMLHINP